MGGNNEIGVSPNIFCIILVPLKEKKEELHRKILWEIARAVACTWWFTVSSRDPSMPALKKSVHPNTSEFM